MSKSAIAKLINGIAIAMTAMLIFFGIYGWAVGWFRDLEGMRAFIGRAGPYGPVAFLTLQVLQVVLPIIPGGLTLMTGVLAFGPWWGFVLNYSGVAIGSTINFTLAKKYGKAIVTHLVDEASYNKYIGRLENSKGFERFFAIAILLPFFPDDTLCLLAGMTNMSYKKFLLIILIGKIPTISVYSILLVTGSHLLTKLM